MLHGLEGELLRNQVMLLLAYDGALRREELVRLEVSRLRCTWLCEQLEALGVHLLLAAAGVSHSQRIFDLAAMLDPGDEEDVIRRLS